MKKIILSLIVVTSLVACRKTSMMENSDATLEVTESNMSVIAKRTATWCGPCGSYGFPAFQTMKDTYGKKAVYMAWKEALSEASSVGDDLFTEVGPQFDLGGAVPTFFYNFIKSDGNDSLIDNHFESTYVVANANYDIEIKGQTIGLKTTTKFFANVEGTYYIAPYLIVDNIVGYQNGHPDGANTVHHNYVAGIAKPTTVSGSKNFGYQITASGAKRGHTINLDFSIPKQVTWKDRDISFAIVIFKQEPWGLQFVNAFTK